jgi:hypothetical protein
MTVPQEFTRLCNAVLITEHGDDFLPIDDDRADRGNDGYLKSEQRMFAVHCFKRVQNQAIDAAIRTKIVGDLGKAIALKQAEIWPIDAWTFLSNYPISEGLGAQVTKIGRDAGIDVAWRGPDYLAAALTRHPEVAAEFPGLQINELSAQLDRIQETMSAEHDAALIDKEPYGGPPRTPDEQDDLLRRTPPGWEYLLFAGVLQQGRNALEAKWRSQELGLPSRTRRFVEASDAPTFLGNAMDRLKAVVEPMGRLFAGQQDAFGAPGEAGDAIRIEHFANWLIGAYEDMLDWGADLRAVDTTDQMTSAIDYTARMVDQPLSQVRHFIDEVVEFAEQIPEHFAKPEVEREGEILTAETILVISLDPEITDRAILELRRGLGLGPEDV